MSGKSFKRTIKDLSPVLFQPPTGGPEDKRAVYEVKRGRPLQNLKIRYDETTIFPGLLGRELPKTFGHYHPKNSAGVYYPEIFEVLGGRAWYLLQKPDPKNPKIIKESYLAEVKEKEKAVMPPGFGHVSLNPERKKLEMANWIGSDFDYDYQTYENLRGGCYYLLESKNGQTVDFEKNSYYEKISELTKVRPKEIPELGIRWDIPLSKLGPKKLEFLLKPEKYLEILTIENCFKRM